ncbi:hypothetical protein [Actinoplanes sp. NPDC089786]|uniref:hypothetical protein n=1 Tax=Actinoplanes sp. NPDC089786 TaxID=3155185 RepID=UPI003429F755
MFSFDHDGDGRRAPGVIQALAILLVVGGALSVLFSIAGLVSGAWLAGVSLLLGVLYLVLARAVQRARPWARPTILVLSMAGVAQSVYQLVTGDLATAIGGLVWPVVYALLVNAAAARAWFRGSRG